MAGITAIDHAVTNGSNGANAAAANPGGMTNDEKAAVGSILKHDEDLGAPVHAFDPDATPEQKAAAAGKARAALAPVAGAEKLKIKKEDISGRAMAIDTSSKSSAPKPTITLNDIARTSQAEGQGLHSDSLPGAVPTGAAPAVPTYILSGWRQVANRDLISAGDVKSAENQSILATYISEQAYGSWYHNAGIILFAVLTTRFFTAIGCGWGWIILILSACSSYYSLSISRTRQRARDDIQRELVKTRLVTETESAEWVNSFLERFWLIYEPVLSQTIIASVDAALAGVTPTVCESIRLTTFTLGNKAPRIDYVRTFPKTPEDVVIMDWALSFTPNDVDDITPRQARNRVNPKIVLSIRVGKGVVSKAIPILLEDINFTGKMRIKLKLMTNFPHVKTIELSFIEKPTFDYVLKPIGGEMFGFDINNIPGLASFIRDQVHSNLGPMMYDPNVFTIDLQALLSGNPLDSAIGVLKVHIIDARGLKAVKLGGGAPDPYVSIGLGAKPPVAKTKTINNSANPAFNETQFILINNIADVLALSVWDYNDHRPDNQLGTVTQELATLAEDAEQEGLVGKILGGGKDRGELRYNLSWFPVLQPTKLPNGTLEPPPETQTGIVRFFIHQAKDLDVTRQHGNIDPFAKIYLGGNRQEIHRTQVMKHSNQPIWESHCEFLVPDKQSSVISLQVIDQRDFATDPKLGNLSVKLTDLLEAGERQQDWFPLQNSRAGKIRLSAVWKPVAMTGSLDGAAVYVPPIGILRLWIKKAVDVKNVEATLGGKSDPYVRILHNNHVLARTEVINNNLNPEWDQIVYVPVHNLRENIILELMDYQNIGKDRSLGYVEVRLSDFAQESSDPEYPYASKGHKILAERIKLDKANAYKGTLHLEVDFKPAMSLKGGVSFEAKKNELELAAEEAAQGDSGSSSDADGSKSGQVRSPGSGHTRTSSLFRHGRKPSMTTTGINNRPETPIDRAAIQRRGASIELSPSRNGENPTESRAGGEATESENPEKGVSHSVEELMSYQSGVLVFQVISGDLARRGSLEVMFDDGYWPAFTSGRARSTHANWDQVGEGFIRELDFSRIWLRINANDPDEREDIVAEFKCDTKDFLDQCIRSPAEFMLSQADGSNQSRIRMSARFVPVNIKLEPRESINNMGILRVDVVSAKGLLAGDRSGKSDPYVVFTLNGMKVFKSDTKKKTLAPVWNESFEVMIPSRVAAKFLFEVQDWNTVGSATALGGNAINLASLEPFESVERSIPVIHDEKGEKGSIVVRLLFQPEIIARTRQKTSTFSTAGRAITAVGGVPMGVGKGVIHGGGVVASGVGHGIGTVGHGIGTVGGFAGRKIGLIKKKDKSGKEVLVQADTGDGGEEVLMDGVGESGYSVPAGQISQPSNDLGTKEAGAGLPGPHATTLPPGQGQPPSEPGQLAVTVLSAKDLTSKEGSSVKPYVVLRCGGKTQKTGHVKGLEPEWNESVSFTVAPGTSTLSLTIHEHHSFGKDHELGDAEVDIWRHIQPAVPTADVTIELTNGTGLIRLKLDWTANSGNGSISGTPVKSAFGRNRASSVRNGSEGDGSSPGRFGLMRSKTKDKEPSG